MSGATCTVCGNLFAPSWGRDVCGVCEFSGHMPRQAPKPAAPKKRNQIDYDALFAQARKHKPIPVPVYREVPAKDWQDNSRDRRGAPARGPLGKQWAGGCCIRAAIASLLNMHIAKVPDPSRLYNRGGPWFDEYNQQVADEIGYRLERLPASMCPPRTHELWIAQIREHGDADHVVVARDGMCVHDSAGIYQGQLPLDRLDGGFVLRPTRRVIPVFSPRRHGHTVVAA
jgi:hypothetical protein